MGIKQQELTPFASPSPITPPTKNSQAKYFQLARTDTTSTVKAMLPAQTSIVGLRFYANANSNAGTTATATITATYTDGTVIGTGTVNLLTGGNTTSQIQFTGIPNIEPLPLKGDINISAVYAETGTASTAGGPWVIGIEVV